MRDIQETPFLRSIAEAYEDDVGRFVLSDFLEERGESARADFLRVQCELAATDLPEERRHALRVRERSLLDAHRHEWLQAFGLPLEDVCYERGLISRMRLSQWDGGKLLDAAVAPWLVTLTELDLSGLGIGDAGLGAFAETAYFPALRKLILNGNEITNGGAAALAAASGLPRLDTVYLFDNPITDIGHLALQQTRQFRLTNLDLGERASGYCMSPGEVEVARRRYIRMHLLPFVSHYFQTYPRLQSALLCVAQYWADEANDAVHGKLIVSELFEPTLEGASSGYGEEPMHDANVPNTRIEREYGEGGSAISLWDAHWDDNSGAIPLWAAFAPEEGSQEYENLEEAYAPAVMFYRHGGYDFLPMCRPHLDGIRPEWGEGE
jgi:uncharacterized protein (TIGR02996 family)